MEHRENKMLFVVCPVMGGGGARGLVGSGEEKKSLLTKFSSVPVAKSSTSSPLSVKNILEIQDSCAQ